MTNQIRILVVDDDERIRFFLQQALKRSGHRVVMASSGEEALDRLRETAFELAILDLNLGGRVDGMRVLKAVRWRWPETATIILTGHGSLETAMTAIREGVDLYLLKPIEASELRQAVQEALERRRETRPTQTVEEPPLEKGPFVLDLKAHVATSDGQPLDLTAREFTLLAHLMQNADQAISPVELVRVVGGYEPEDLYDARQTIKWYIHHLRRKVEPDPSSPRYIVTVREVGYRFIE
jgi:DNA-binding response OmpR family regulator